MTSHHNKTTNINNSIIRLVNLSTIDNNVKNAHIKPKHNNFYNDLHQTLKQNISLSLLLGWLDIKLKYRRSALGPWWITISMLIFVGALGCVYSQILKQPINKMIPFLATGFTIWMFISTCINEGASILSDSQMYIKQVKMPFSIHIFRLMYRNIIIMAHNLVVYFLVVVFFQVHINWNILLAIPGLMLIILTLYPIILIIAMIGARYRDMPQVIISIMQVIFFVSPITWMPHLVGPNSKILIYNPVSYALDLVREPMLGHAPQLESWVAMAILFITALICARFMMNKYYDRISFWM